MISLINNNFRCCQCVACLLLLSIWIAKHFQNLDPIQSNWYVNVEFSLFGMRSRNWIFGVNGCDGMRKISTRDTFIHVIRYNISRKELFASQIVCLFSNSVICFRLFRGPALSLCQYRIQFSVIPYYNNGRSSYERTSLRRSIYQRSIRAALIPCVSALHIIFFYCRARAFWAMFQYQWQIGTFAVSPWNVNSF